MRKNEQRRPRPSRKTRNKSYRSPEPRLDIDSKGAHNREVMFQLRACDEFIDQVNGTLQVFAKRIDRDGRTALGEYHNECVTILDTINDDLHDFCSKLKPLQQQAKSFMDNPQGEAWEWTMNTHSICESLNLLRDQYVTLYMANYNSLMDQLDR
jgi:hypothetical protein